MQHCSRIFIIILTVILLTLSSAMAASKFINKDTAKNRQDTAFGTETETEDGEPITTIKQKRKEDTVIRSKRKKKEQVDWYDKVIISVEPQVDVKE